MQEHENAVETAELGKKYRSLWALKDCEVAVPAGSVSALVGPNGAGKTTLLKLLAGLNARAQVGQQYWGSRHSPAPSTWPALATWLSKRRFTAVSRRPIISRSARTSIHAGTTNWP